MVVWEWNYIWYYHWYVHTYNGIRAIRSTIQTVHFAFDVLKFSTPIDECSNQVINDWFIHYSRLFSIDFLCLFIERDFLKLKMMCKPSMHTMSTQAHLWNQCVDYKIRCAQLWTTSMFVTPFRFANPFKIFMLIITCKHFLNQQIMLNLGLFLLFSLLAFYTIYRDITLQNEMIHQLSVINFWAFFFYAFYSVLAIRMASTLMTEVSWNCFEQKSSNII